MEVFLFGAHSLSLLLQILDCISFWTNFSTQLLDFVIQDKLELFELHNFLSQLCRLNLLLFNGDVALLILLLVNFDVRLLISLLLHGGVNLVHKVVKLLLFIISFSIFLAQNHDLFRQLGLTLQPILNFRG